MNFAYALRIYSSRARCSLRWAILVACGLIISESPIAVGQTANGADAPAAAPAAAADQAQSGELQTVTVTARYRTENLQTTPLAITAISGPQLQERAVLNTSDLGAVVPNLFTHPGDAEEGPTPTISMRGVTAGDYSFEAFPAVGIYIDDIYHSTMVGSAVDLTDIDRIEVNRGPQGTLSGNSSIAGSINIYTKDARGDNSAWRGNALHLA